MKKSLLLLVISISAIVCVYADTPTKTEVDLKTTTSNTPQPRSLPAQANAWIDSFTSLLTIQVLYAQGGVDVMLTDARGQIVHQDSAVADGSKQHLMLPVLDAGTYYLTISCNGTQWEGEMFLY